MRYSEAECRAAAEALVSSLNEKGLLQLQTEQRRSAALLAQALLENFRQEEDLRREAERLAEAHMPAGQAVDRHKVVQMIIQRLAEERSFVL